MDRLSEIERLVRNRYFGKYRGKVIDNNDSTQRGRLQVAVPAVLESLNLWAMPCVPYAGPSVGFYSLPPVGAGVWVEFEGGDPSFPVWVGCFWGDGDLPEEATSPDVHLLRTTQGLISIDDGSGDMLLQNQNQASVTLAQDVTTVGGQAKQTVGSAGVVSESGAGGKVEVAGPGVKVNSGAFEVM
ncbi:hypothetical protein SAMN02745857_00772 [Andreprevotia lacus DSM 23236]|jgi:uncharacterized protein involved in type VI secretion and phage assembly|uniref:Gp5/Type VI secretion system Vgr protein OB-fold domain-containing protein n=1 Tax=Andreprevotia lacus DSM 23236 TaxID=1121001 RepID=A0A1W1X877_9NEIS|nr:phage baseplate assembly protein V [Andreprevotia lacus]SMC19701.1 hypothetical protein SAMN02745857_00772 [Andreprevotia lacus DSM 23236]